MTITSAERDVASLWDAIVSRVARGDRFAGLHATRPGAAGPRSLTRGGAVTLTAHLATAAGIDSLSATLPPGATSYPSLTGRVPAAFWYERVIHDQTGLVPAGHPRLAPLIRPGSPRDHALPRHVEGYGLFTIPHGPVRSGVLESMEYLVETPGEAIPHLNMRIFYKHRAVAGAFTGRPAADGVLLAERAEGIASVAHALAYCHAIEALAGVAVPGEAALVRVIHAELERIANHLDVAMRLCDAAGLAVATARMALHKERVMRLVSALCGSRFGRGVVIPGGVAGLPRRRPLEVRAHLDPLQRAVAADLAAALSTSSFLDRLRGTGPLSPARAREHGALGPVGKASGYADDARTARPYDAYAALDVPPPRAYAAGDAQARLMVRADEIAQSFSYLRRAIADLSERSPVTAAAPGAPPGSQPGSQPGGQLGGLPEGLPDGRAVGWAEAPQGEVLYDVVVADGRVACCQVRSASFHNLYLMHEVFKGDVLTDFPFIEASFGLSVAGAAL